MGCRGPQARRASSVTQLAAYTVYSVVTGQISGKLQAKVFSAAGSLFVTLNASVVVYALTVGLQAMVFLVTECALELLSN